jgi:hypothetical protein
MSLIVLTAATSRRLTTAEALYQDTGNVVYLEEPTLVNAMIDQASSAIVSYCGREFAQQRYEEIGPGVDGPTLNLDQYPLVTVESLTTYDLTPIEEYRIDHRRGMLIRRQGWGYYGRYHTWGWWDELTGVYVAGYILPEQTTPAVPSGPTLPADIERAYIECVKVWHAEKSPENRITSRRLGDQSISYSVQSGKTALPVLSQSILQPYRRWVLV